MLPSFAQNRSENKCLVTWLPLSRWRADGVREDWWRPACRFAPAGKLRQPPAARLPAWLSSHQAQVQSPSPPRPARMDVRPPPPCRMKPCWSGKTSFVRARSSSSVGGKGTSLSWRKCWPAFLEDRERSCHRPAAWRWYPHYLGRRTEGRNQRRVSGNPSKSVKCRATMSRRVASHR